MTTPSLYEKDYACWAETMVQMLQVGAFDKLDIDNLVEELNDLSKRERDRLLSSIRLILHHLLKWDVQPQKRSRSWQITIERERNNIGLYLEDSPSLQRYLTQEWVEKMYRNARLDAMEETNLDLPKDCQYSIEDVLGRPIEL
jgi:hypothetical protein